ncbi:hypothetical protein [Pseudomonas mosselii]|uniref:hypothetical protein n=1 Tax=Pseudomonas mosselii TaxID=78327 RepID=UPI003C7BE5FE
MREGSLRAGEGPRATPTHAGAAVALGRGVALCAVLAAMAFAGLSLYLALPLALLVLWVPLARKAVVAQSTPAAAADSSLLQELARGTSHNALSAAAVAHSVQQLAARVQSQLGAA